MPRQAKYTDYRSLLLSEEAGEKIDQIHEEKGLSAGAVMRSLISMGLTQYEKNGENLEEDV